jgi:hypothetical protein
MSSKGHALKGWSVACDTTGITSGPMSGYSLFKSQYLGNKSWWKALFQGQHPRRLGWSYPLPFKKHLGNSGRWKGFYKEGKEAQGATRRMTMCEMESLSFRVCTSPLCFSSLASILLWTINSWGCFLYYLPEFSLGKHITFLQVKCHSNLHSWC